MAFIEKFAGCVLGGAVLSLCAAPNAHASASLTINDAAPLSVQTPTGTAAAISYTGGQAGALTAYTDGFLFCANVYPDTPPSITQVSFTPAHEDQTFAPAHPWTFASTVDVRAMSYTGGDLSINRDASGAIASTLTCHGVGALGDIVSGHADGLFDSGMESTTTDNYTHLVNWQPAQGFDWDAPDWTQVPADACDSYASPNTIEDVACAAVSGVRPAVAGGLNRAGSMWTTSDGTSFTYAFRIDARSGAQAAAAPAHFTLPTRVSVASYMQTQSSAAETVAVRDAYDAAFLSDSGQFCYLAALPATLDSSTCASAATSYPLNGPLSDKFVVEPPPINPAGATSFYVVVTRPIGASSHSNLATPVVGVAVVIDPVIAAEGGDRFIGDDVLFGFLPASPGFPWMTSTPQ